jgi:very-short-patch-repair endonuclease
VSALEDLLERHIRLTGLPAPTREYRFHPRRRWRFDFAWPGRRVAVEVDGGIYSRGRHVRGSGFERDAEKRNAAVTAGWRVLHFTPRQVKSGAAVREIEALLSSAAADQKGFQRQAHEHR